MSFMNTFKKSKCVKCLSGKFVSKSKLHAQNQNGKYSRSLSWNNKSQTINILKPFLTLIRALKSPLYRLNIRFHTKDLHYGGQPQKAIETQVGSLIRLRRKLFSPWFCFCLHVFGCKKFKKQHFYPVSDNGVYRSIV